MAPRPVVVYEDSPPFLATVRRLVRAVRARASERSVAVVRFSAAAATPKRP